MAGRILCWMGLHHWHVYPLYSGKIDIYIELCRRCKTPRQ